MFRWSADEISAPFLIHFPLAVPPSAATMTLMVTNLVMIFRMIFSACVFSLVQDGY